MLELWGDLGQFGDIVFFGCLEGFLGKLWEFMIEVLGYFLEYRIWMIKYCYLCCLCCAKMMIIFITKI